MSLRDKIKGVIDSLLDDKDVNLIEYCEEAVDGIVPNESDHMISHMPTGRYSLIIDFERASQVEAFQKRRSK